MIIKKSDTSPGDNEILKGKETILFVDDEEALRLLTQKLLNRMGYNIVLAENGIEAYQIYQERKNEISLVILDLYMPHESGATTFYKLKDINPQIKVLLLSGHNMNSLARQLIQNGAVGFIQKPFDFNGLVQEIRTILDE